MIVRDSVVTGWLASAKAGERLVYARATFLPAGSKLAERLRDLAAAGKVRLFVQRREQGMGQENFNYIVERTGAPIDATAGAFRQNARRAAGASMPQDRRTGAAAAMRGDVVPLVRGLLAEGAAANASALARTLGVYSARPVRLALREIERLAA
jgi:hypothetical protein